MNGTVYINGKELILPERAKTQYSYAVTYDMNNTDLDFEYLLNQVGCTDGAGFKTEARDTLYLRALTKAGAATLRSISGIKSVTQIVAKQGESNIFSHNPNWNGDNFGPIYIPQAGKTLALNLKTLPFYKRIISVYEKNDLKVVGNEIYINDKKVTSYTFKQNYYWMMGDNRHNSEDSRYWGYVPEDHIVGKPVFIWMSWDTNGKGINKIRWERLFTTVGGDGQPQSYFKYFLGLLALYFVGDYFWKKRKASKV
jgi:signal peptidase I